MSREDGSRAATSGAGDVAAPMGGVLQDAPGMRRVNRCCKRATIDDLGILWGLLRAVQLSKPEFPTLSLNSKKVLLQGAATAVFGSTQGAGDGLLILGGGRRFASFTA